MQNYIVMRFCVLKLLFSCTIAVLSTNITLYYSNMGYDSRKIGLAVSVTTFVAVFGQFLWGYLSDAINSNKKIILICMFALLFWVCLFFGNIIQISIMFFAAAVGLFHQPVNTVMDVWILKAVKPGGKYDFAFIHSWAPLGAGIFSVVYCWMLDNIGYSVSFYFSVLSVSATIAMVIFIKSGNDPTEKSANRGLPPRVVFELLKDKKLLIVFAVYALLGIAIYAEFLMIQLRIKLVGGTAFYAGICIFVMEFVQWSTLILYRRLMTRFRPSTLLLAGVVLYIIYFGLQACASTPGMIVAIASVSGLAFGIFLPSLRYIIFEISAPELRNLTQSCADAIGMGFCGAVGGLIGGGLVVYFDGRLLMLFCITFGLIAAIPAAIYHAKFSSR